MADVRNWLTSRLTPASAQSERWTDLAKAVEAFWDQNFEPSMDAFDRSRSIFTSDDTDIALKLAERGKKFEVALPITPSSMAMAYAMRSYEIHQKDHQGALEIILQRDFGNVVIRWMPLKAPIALPYGELFITDVENQWIGIPESELWQTSRAKVLVDTSAALAFGLDRPAVAAALQRKLDELRPAHIVYDGILFISWFPIEVAPVVLGAGPRISRERFATVDADPLLPFRLDDFRLDDFRLDWFSPLSLGAARTAATLAPVAVPFRFPWRLDMGWEIGGQFRARPGIEGDAVEPLYSLGADSATQDKIAVFPADFTAGPVESAQVHLFETLLPFRLDDFRLDDFRLDWFSPLSLGAARTAATLAPVAVPFRFPWRLDMGWEIGGQFRARPGIEGDAVEPLYSLGADSATQDKIAVFPTDFTAGPVESAQVHLFDDVGEGVLTLGQGRGVTQSAFVSGLSPLAEMPSLDDVPLDFAPLDLRYN